MLYFSYGSNMSAKRLLQRIRAMKIGVAELREHRLCFHKASESDGSAKCDILYTGDPDDFILGVVYEIEESQKPILDGIEGLGFGYSIKTVTVAMGNKSVDAFTYYAISINPSLKPFAWYKQHVLVGALENSLPSDYIQRIDEVETVSDMNSERRNQELSIYN